MYSDVLVSVGISSYNRPQLLKRAIESVKNQSYPNIEILVSDDASPNRAVVEVVNESGAGDKRVRAFLHEKNSGPFANFKFLLEHATGEFFIWLCDDDYWSPHFLENLVRAAQSSGSALLFGDAVVVDNITGQEVWVVPSMPSSGSVIVNVANFATYDNDPMFYGLFRRTVGLKYKSLLKDFHVPQCFIKDFGFIRYDFVTYLFILAMLLEGRYEHVAGLGGCQYIGNVSSLGPKGKTGGYPYWARVFVLVLLSFYVHMQFASRLFVAFVSAGNLRGAGLAPLLGGYFFFRRLCRVAKASILRKR